MDRTIPLAVLACLSACGPPAPPALTIVNPQVLSSGQESFICQRVTILNEALITGFRAVMPVGTHHVVVTLGQKEGPDGVAPCSPATLDPHVIFAAAIGGGQEVRFPEGVAVKLPAGQQLLLNWHLLNATPHTLPVAPRVEMFASGPAPADLAEVILAGDLARPFQVPPGTKHVHVDP